MTTAAAGSVDASASGAAAAASVTQASGAAAAVAQVAGAQGAAAAGAQGAAAAGAQGAAAESDVIGTAPDAGAEAAKAAAEAGIEIKLPEGVKADDKLLEGFKPIAKELGLKSDGAQKLVDLYAATMKQNAEASDAAWKQAQAKWKDEVKADKELGGQNFESTRVEVGRFFNAFDKDGAIRKDIAMLGLGNHPGLVRLAVRAAKLMKEDGVASGNAPGSGELSEEEALRVRYPTMFK